MHESHARIQGNKTKQSCLVLGEKYLRANETADHAREDDYARKEGGPPAHQDGRFDVYPL